MFKEIILPIILFIIGLVLIVKGGDIFVDASSWIAESFGIPKVLVGATIVSFATTLPEVLVSILAAIGGDNTMAIGNAVGSVNVNIGFIFALLLVVMPGMAKRNGILVKSLLMLSACVTLAIFALYGELPIFGSIILLLIFIAFMVVNVADAKKALKEEKQELIEHPELAQEKPKKDKKSIIINIVKFVVGAAALALGARLLVDNGQIIAKNIGIPTAIISAIFVAIGTSLPELVTAITAIVKKEGALSVGNIIGANIIDLSLILPVCAFIGGTALPFGAQNAYLDMPVCLVIGALSLVPTLFTQKLQRWQGISLMVVYVAYVSVMCTVFV